MNIEAKNFKYNTDLVCEKTFSEHLELYKSYVNKFNLILTSLETSDDVQSVNATYSTYRSLKEAETYTLDAVVLHELYFQIISSEKTSPQKSTMTTLEKHFLTYENWLEDFVCCAKSSRGYAILSYDQRSGRFCNLSLDAHNKGVVVMAFPLIVLDVYEHAYICDYGLDKEKYIRKFIENINWNIVERQISKL